MIEDYRRRLKSNPDLFVQEILEAKLKNNSDLDEETVEIIRNELKNFFNELFENESLDISLENFNSQIDNIFSFIKYNNEFAAIKIGISQGDYRGYVRLIAGKSLEELRAYEDRAFTYDTGVVKNVKTRIYDAMVALYDEQIHLQQAGECSSEKMSFVIDILDEIHHLLHNQEIELALEKLVALQLRLRCGTKFLTQLRKILIEELSIDSILGMDKSKDHGKGKGRS